MKMENIMHRAGFEPTSLALQANVLTIHPPRHPDATHAYLRMRLLA